MVGTTAAGSWRGGVGLGKRAGVRVQPPRLVAYWRHAEGGVWSDRCPMAYERFWAG